MGKVINMNGEEVEVVNREEARTFFMGRNGEIMKPRSFMQLVYRKDKYGTPVLPKGIAYTKTTRGNYWFSKKHLLGLKEKDTAA